MSILDIDEMEQGLSRDLFFEEYIRNYVVNPVYRWDGRTYTLINHPNMRKRYYGIHKTYNILSDIPSSILAFFNDIHMEYEYKDCNIFILDESTPRIQLKNISEADSHTFLYVTIGRSKHFMHNRFKTLIKHANNCSMMPIPVYDFSHLPAEILL